MLADGTLLVPPFTGRLHCGGEVAAALGTTRAELVPPFTGRLHCGRPRRHTRDYTELSYRPSPGGSIAAGPPHPGHVLGFGSYRPSPGGSIAARNPAPGRRRSVASYRPSPGGSIAAARRRRRRRPASPLVPPFTGRLHCGEQTLRAPDRTLRSYRPSPGGSIAAAVPLASAASTLTPRTALHRAAPLRLLLVGRPDSPPALVPPFTGRLHCGAGSSWKKAMEVLLVPPFTGRLHCGLRIEAYFTDRRYLVPPFTGRLHCGWVLFAAVGLDENASYRPSPGGSIAASGRGPSP